MSEQIAQQEAAYGWQHPVSFVNWLTTDALSHPLEPFHDEDRASIDPSHIVPTQEFIAGYYACFHAYPYYPEFIMLENRHCPSCQGKMDPYAGYLARLRLLYPNITIVVGEFGLPSSRSKSHDGPVPQWDQGEHSETGQGLGNALLFRDIYEAGMW